MKHWMKIDHTKHPSFSTSSPLSLCQIEDQIFQAGLSRGVLTCRGSWFRAEKQSELDETDEATADIGSEIFFRATFAAASEDDIREAIRRFGEGLKEVFGL